MHRHQPSMQRIVQRLWPSVGLLVLLALLCCQATVAGSSSLDAPQAAAALPSPSLHHPVPSSSSQTDSSGGMHPAQPTEPAHAHTPWQDLTLSFLMILGSEVGDKTFLIAAVLAMRQPRVLIFSATMAAMIVMSVLSALMGHVLPNLLPQRWVDLCAGVLFLLFGIWMAREGAAMDGTEQHKELEEVRAELEEKEWQIGDGASKEAFAMELGTLVDATATDKAPSAQLYKSAPRSSLQLVLMRLLSPVFIQTFTLVFIAEWGDRSQFATIAMAAAQDVTWTVIGTVLGHAACTALAVVGGRLLAQRISVRAVTLAGAVLFVIFSIIYFYTFASHTATPAAHAPLANA